MKWDNSAKLFGNWKGDKSIIKSDLSGATEYDRLAQSRDFYKQTGDTKNYKIAHKLLMQFQTGPGTNYVDSTKVK